MEGFIDLERRFEVISHDKANKESLYDFGYEEPFSFLGHYDSVDWDEILKFRRVVLLSTAGSGKTVELKNAVSRLRKKGETAFFLRIEDCVEDVDDAFEESEDLGYYDEFLRWLGSSNQRAWIMLDSVDESRISDPRHFEQALRKIKRKIKDKFSLVNILISSRPQAWRACSDLRLCRKYLGEDNTISEDGKSDENGGYNFFRLSDLSKRLRKFFSVKVS